jgi:hypothetical protein
MVDSSTAAASESSWRKLWISYENTLRNDVINKPLEHPKENISLGDGFQTLLRKYFNGWWRITKRNLAFFRSKIPGECP